MTKEERVEKYGSFLYCPKRETLCMGQDYEGTGECLLETCVLDDPAYQARQERIQRRQKELWDKHRGQKKEEKEAAANIRAQNKTSQDLLRMKIEKTRSKMERYYRKGWTNLANKLGLELAEMERRLRA
ncbi:hypothetical protein D3Z38_11720 [Clostridiales bacterium]|nr:hypothetical protein [Clostridiales bacterium]